MNVITFTAFNDELAKIAFDVMHAAKMEGIALAKTLKARQAVPKAGNTLKDYMHHMDLSAHPSFKQGMKATAQGPVKKVASAWSHAAELGGLGILAAPSIQHLRGKEMNEKTKSKAEVAGLGVLAAPTAVGVAKKGISAIRKFKHAGVKKAALDAWNPTTGAVMSGSGGTRGANLGTHVGGAAQAAKKTFTLDHLKGAYQKAGIKPGLGSAVRAAASHIK